MTEYPHDRAIVVGIRRYPGYSAPPSALKHLEGPDNDADAVYDWLINMDEGSVPKENVRLIRSSDFPDPFPNSDSWAPQEAALRKELVNLTELPQNTFEGQYAGRRLYIYVSGHGFAQARTQGALLTAEGQANNCLHIFISDWFECLYNAALFKEYVLWMDCCMTQDVLTPLSPCTLRRGFSRDADKGLAFTAFSARFPKRSVENQMPNGKWHGVFTYALLIGLRGAAANAGTVTTRSLKDYLIGNMRSFMHEDDQDDPEVSREPDFGRDDSFELARLQTPAVNGRAPFTLRFQPEAIGRRAVISKNLSTEVAAIVLEQLDWQVQLAPGIYSVSLERTGYPVAFQVVGGGVDAPFHVV